MPGTEGQCASPCDWSLRQSPAPCDGSGLAGPAGPPGFCAPRTLSQLNSLGHYCPHASQPLATMLQAGLWVEAGVGKQDDPAGWVAMSCISLSIIRGQRPGEAAPAHEAAGTTLLMR